MLLTLPMCWQSSIEVQIAHRAIFSYIEIHRNLTNRNINIVYSIRNGIFLRQERHLTFFPRRFELVKLSSRCSSATLNSCLIRSTFNLYDSSSFSIISWCARPRKWFSKDYKIEDSIQWIFDCDTESMVTYRNKKQTYISIPHMFVTYMTEHVTHWNLGVTTLSVSSLWFFASHLCIFFICSCSICFLWCCFICCRFIWFFFCFLLRLFSFFCALGRFSILCFFFYILPIDFLLFRFFSFFADIETKIAFLL